MSLSISTFYVIIILSISRCKDTCFLQYGKIILSCHPIVVLLQKKEIYVRLHITRWYNTILGCCCSFLYCKLDRIKIHFCWLYSIVNQYCRGFLSSIQFPFQGHCATSLPCSVCYNMSNEQCKLAECQLLSAGYLLLGFSGLVYPCDRKMQIDQLDNLRFICSVFHRYLVWNL